MKKIFLLFVALTLGIGPLCAQKIGYINTDQILNEIPAYLAAQDQLNALTEKYKGTIDAEMAKVEKMYQDYQASRSSMSAVQRQNAENEIISRERAVQEKQRIYFGEDGIMAKKAEELLTPIRNDLDKAIEDVAEMGGFDMIIDLAAVQGVVYKKASLDLSKFVLVRYKENHN